MTPRERFITALSGGMPDRIPMVIWNNKLPGHGIDEKLLELGVCVVVKSSVWIQRYDGIEIETTEEQAADGNVIRHTIFKTSSGILKTEERLMPWTIWIEKFPFSGPDDYNALEVLISSRGYDPDFNHFLADDKKYGDQSLARPLAIRAPMQELIYDIMGIENFSIEYAQNRDRVLHILDVLKEDWLKRVKLTSMSPAIYAIIDGNTEISVVGPDRFMTYYYPCIEEGCQILHDKGILVGDHLDGNNKVLAPMIAKTSLDFVESFTPPPQCDLAVSEARQVWPDKAIQVHFPSVSHLGGIEEIKTQVKQILAQAAPGDRFIIGTSEDVPNRGIDTLLPLYETIARYGIDLFR
jgi:hypothetical protein